MEILQTTDLFSLEQYAVKRPAYRAEIMAHKKNRHVAIGPNATLYFEDRKTIQYQIQEMLRIEKIFERAGIEEELESYNPLIPNGSNWKATFMLEYPDEAERRIQLGKLIGVEKKRHGCAWRVLTRSIPSATKTLIGRPRTKPHRFTSCALSSPARCARL